jgi:hypothetical protein
MQINIIAVICAAIAAFILGAIWYMALGRQWQAALGLPADQIKKPGAPPVPALVTSFLAEVVMALVLAIMLSRTQDVTLTHGAILGALCWLGFVVTTVTVNNAYPGRKLMLTAIDSLHWLLVLVAEGVIIGAFGPGH